MKNLILDKAKAGELLTERELMELGFKCESGILSSYKKDGIEFTFCGGELSSIYIDDEDIEIMQEYLINSKDVSSLEQADMNSDSKLSIIDLSLLIKQQKECPYDKNNATNITSWSAVPMVSKELLQKQGVTTGGEGCQWPIGMAISKDGQLV